MKPFLNHFDFMHGLYGATGMGTILFFVNKGSGMTKGIHAAIAQAIISFLIVGINTGVFKKLYHHNKLEAILVPTLFTTLIASIVHYVTGTPQLMWSILSVFLLGGFHFSMLSLAYARFGTVDPHHLFSQK